MGPVMRGIRRPAPAAASGARAWSPKNTPSQSSASANTGQLAR